MCNLLGRPRDFDVSSDVQVVGLTLNRPGFLESSTAGGGGGGFRPPCVTSLFEDQ